MDAIVGALGARGVMNVDELRRGIESMPPDDYERASYYERWLYSSSRSSRRRACSTHELRGRTARSHLGAKPRRASPHSDYVKGKTGTVVLSHGTFTNPRDPRVREDGLPSNSCTSSLS